MGTSNPTDLGGDIADCFSLLSSIHLLEVLHRLRKLENWLLKVEYLLVLEEEFGLGS